MQNIFLKHDIVQFQQVSLRVCASTREGQRLEGSWVYVPFSSASTT